MPTARVDIILYIADRNDSRQISLLMNTCCEFFSWPKFLMIIKKHVVFIMQPAGTKKKSEYPMGIENP